MYEVIRLLEYEIIESLPRIFGRVAKTEGTLQLFRHGREWIGTRGVIDRIGPVAHHSQDSSWLTLQVHLKSDKISNLVCVPGYRNNSDEIDERFAVLLVINERHLALLKIVYGLPDMRNAFIICESAGFALTNTTGWSL